MKTKQNTTAFKYRGHFLIVFLLFSIIKINAQVRVDFTERVSDFQSAKDFTKEKEGKIYNLRGDFTMLGNSNVELSTSNNNNAYGVKYVDIDGTNNNTINSSSARLSLPAGNCTQIVYAGLYWSGRGQTSSNNNAYTLNAGSVTYTTNDWNAVNVTNSTSSTPFSLPSVSRQVTNNNYYPRIRFNIVDSNNYVEFEYVNSIGSTMQYRINGGAWQSVAGTNADLGNNTHRFTFTTPLIVTVNNVDYRINYVQRDSRTSRSETQYRNTSRVNASSFGPKSVTETKTLDKRSIKFKFDNDTYQDRTTANDRIFFSNDSNNDYMYASYLDVTDYVKNYLTQNPTADKDFYVADLPTVQGGNFGGWGGGDATGRYGGWGLVVIYENPTMKWRDITVFDGYAYVVGGTESHNIPIRGFEAAQNGAVNVTIGVMAGEGDQDITGDYMRIVKSASKPANFNDYATFTGTNNDWVTLTHAGNTPTGNNPQNFFNSSIQVDNTIRNKNLTNNAGIDIAKFNLPNSTKNVINNSDTSTIINYGSTQDTYIIYNLVFAVDAYVPETEVFSVVTPPTGTAINNLQPNDIVTLTADIHNYGTDAVNNGKLQINIPQGMQLISAVVNTPSNSGANGTVNFGTPTWTNPVAGGVNGIPAATLGGVLDWDLGYIPTQALVGGLKVPLATLTYQLKVTDDCMILQASKDNCILYPEVEGTITGKGALSGSDFSQELIIGYNTDCNNTPIYGGLEMKINPSETFLNACSTSNPVVNDIRMFKRFCSATGGVIPRAEVIGVAPYNYPEGTVFYDESGVVITGDFPIDPLGNIIMYRAVLPGSPLSCYLKLATQLDIITQSPSISNIDVCFGTGFTLNPTATGQDPSTSFYYFENGSATQLAAAPQPNKPGVYTYQVALGKVEGVNYCFGPKTTFTITIRNCKTPVNPMIYTPLNR